MQWPFKRRRQQDSLPPEVQEYYQTEKRERSGLAWLLALGTLLATLAIAMGLFWGGRWLYRTLTDQNDKPAAPIQEGVPSQPANTQAPSQTPAAPGADTPPTNTGQASSTPPSTPATGSSGQIPRTGPEEDL